MQHTNTHVKMLHAQYNGTFRASGSKEISLKPTDPYREKVGIFFKPIFKNLPVRNKLFLSIALKYDFRPEKTISHHFGQQMITIGIFDRHMPCKRGL